MQVEIVLQPLIAKSPLLFVLEAKNKHGITLQSYRLQLLDVNPVHLDDAQIEIMHMLLGDMSCLFKAQLQHTIASITEMKVSTPLYSEFKQAVVDLFEKPPPVSDLG